MLILRLSYTRQRISLRVVPLQNICHIYTIAHEPGNVVTMLDERCEKCIDKVVVFPRVLVCTLTLILSIAGHSLVMLMTS